MLTPQQVTSARQTLGITPVATAPGGAAVPTPQTRIAALDTAWGNPSSTAPAAAALPPVSPLPPKPAPEENIGQMDADELNNSANKITGSIKTAGTRIAADADGTLGGEAKAVGDTLEGLGGAGAGAIQGILSPVTASIKKLQAMAADNPAIQELATSKPVSDLLDLINKASSTVAAPIEKVAAEHPRAAEDIGNAATIASTVAGGEGGLIPGVAKDATLGDVVDAVKSSAGDATAAAKSATAATQAKISDLLASSGKKAIAKTQEATQATKGAGLVNGVRSKMATGVLGMEGNVSPQAQTAGKALAQGKMIGAGAAKMATGSDMYKGIVAQHELHMNDIKQDTALDKVGDKIGQGFDQVVKARQEAGANMSDELNKVGDKKVDVGDATQNFHNALAESGAGIDDEGKVIGGSESKFSPEDIKILQKYKDELDTLGDKPTMKQVDAFVGRVPQTIKGMKSTLGINFKTNAERIIGNSLGDTRKALEAAGSPAYRTARKTYSDLSNFLKEGAKHLGAKTQSGGYARDASMAKSAVQSLLNNGKKDWLVKLEGLTGHPYLDHSVLALQAMKDLGDFKGLSLLENTKGLDELVKGAATPHGMAAKIIGMGAKVGGRMVAGSPVQRTTAYLEGLERAAKDAERAKKVTAGAPKNADDEAFKNFPRGTGLSPADKQVEDASIKKYLADPEGMRDQYLKANGNVVNTDEARKLFTDVGYNGSNSAAVHEASSKVANDAFRHLLANSTQKDAYFMAGGSGAGKSTATRGPVGDLIKEASVNLDGNLSRPDAAFKKIDAAVAAGKTPKVVYVYRDPVEAWNNGVIKRMLSSATDKGRVVPLKNFLENTEGALDTVKKIIQQGKAQVQSFSNEGASNGSRQLSSDEVMKLKTPADMQKQLTADTENLARSGKISEEQYNALMADLPHTSWQQLQ